MDTLLYQIEHINETVIALPPAVEVNPTCHPHLQQDKLQISLGLHITLLTGLIMIAGRACWIVLVLSLPWTRQTIMVCVSDFV